MEPKVSVKLTLPVGQPAKEGLWHTVVLWAALATSARTNTRLPKGKGLLSEFPVTLEPCKLKVVVLVSGFTVSIELLELLGPYVASPE